MGKAIGALYNRIGICVFFCLCGMVLISILPLPYLGTATGYAAPRFSITSANEPLHKTLARIAKVTGYQIEITKGWKNKSLTVDLQKTTLEESLQAIIRAMGGPNHVMIMDDGAKKVEIRIFEASTTGKYKAKDVDVVTTADFQDEKHLPQKTETGPDIADQHPPPELNMGEDIAR
ncbi:MAG: hypothetical protein K4571_09760 [Deltaproteobacteria bacterium]